MRNKVAFVLSNYVSDTVTTLHIRLNLYPQSNSGKYLI